MITPTGRPAGRRWICTGKSITLASRSWSCRISRISGINPVSELAWEDHIPADWPARALLWMCSAEADTYCGEEISLRDEGIRKAIGLV